MTQSHRLAAILAADVAGYSRLMGADEEGTLERLKALRRELLEPNIAEHHGRIVKTTGDGFLVEFASVVDAVRCAVAVQQAMPERNIDIGADNRLDLRIGINLGDVIVEGDDLYGDGVNIAARIEALADAGGVFVSNTVHDQVRDRLPFAFEDLGEQQVKNIARPVWVYRVCPALTHPVPAERGRGPKTHDAPGSSLSSDRLGKTMANPRYADDLSRLDRIYDRKAVINRETIIIVIGKSIPVELLDRPVAELLRDEIDRRGGKEHPFRRAIVITDLAWYAEAQDIGFNAVIAVGGPRSNELTKEFEDKPARRGNKIPYIWPRGV